MRKALAVAVLLGIVASSITATAQSCSSAPSSWGDTSAYESWCKACGGTISGSGPRIQCTPGPNWGKSGSSSTASSSASNDALYQASYQLGYALGRWLVGGSNPQARAQKQLMMAELQRRQAEAVRQHRT